MEHPASPRTREWPAAPDRLAAARRLLADLAGRGGRIVVAPHGDVDGLGAGALALRAIERLGGVPIVCLPGKGEHVHAPAMRARLASIAAEGLVVLDMGSRAGPIVPGLPTIVIDHHDAREVPDGAIFVSASGLEPVAPTGLLTYVLLRELVDIEDVAWLAWLATVGDLGTSHPFADELAPVIARHRKTHVQKAVALVNAARRAGRYRPEVALAVLLAAKEPADIARGVVPGVAELEACRVEVQAELARVAPTPPRFLGNVALLRFSSPAQIHPIVATKWASRLAPRIVLAANDGYLPGRVNFSMRSRSSTDLLAFLRGLPLGPVDGEFANGHPQATGGSLRPEDFERLLHALGDESSAGVMRRHGTDASRRAAET